MCKSWTKLEIDVETTQVRIQQKKGELPRLFDQKTPDILTQDEHQGQESRIFKVDKFHLIGIGTLTN